MPQESFAAFELAGFGGGDQLVPGKFPPARAQVACARDPENDMQIAQTAGALLAVRLQAEGGIVVTAVALCLFKPLGLEEHLRIELRAHGGREFVESLAAAGEQARLKQGGLDGDVAAGFLTALGDAAHAVADFDADVPQRADQRRDPFVMMIAGVVGQQQQNVDIGSRVKLAAAITADGGQRHLFGDDEVLPDVAQHFIDQRGAAAQHGIGIGAGFIGRAQFGLACLQAGAQARE